MSDRTGEDLLSVRWQAGWRSSISDSHSSQRDTHRHTHIFFQATSRERGNEVDRVRYWGVRWSEKGVRMERTCDRNEWEARRSRSSSDDMVRSLRGKERARQEMCVCGGDKGGGGLENGQRSMECRQWKTARGSGGGLDLLTESILQCVTGVSLNESPYFTVTMNSLSPIHNHPSNHVWRGFSCHFFSIILIFFFSVSPAWNLLNVGKRLLLYIIFFLPC